MNVVNYMHFANLNVEVKIKLLYVISLLSCSYDQAIPPELTDLKWAITNKWTLFNFENSIHTIF